MATTTTSTHEVDDNPEHVDLDAAQGIAIHRAIGALLGARSEWRSRPTLSDIAAAASVGCGDRPTGSTKEKAFRQGVTTAVGVYARRFVLDTDWTFKGAEVNAPGSRFDLVWEHDDGRVLIDEIKRGATRNNHTAANQQVQRYLKAGKTLFGSQFVGVRLIWVSAPLGSQFYAAGRIRAVALSSAPELIGAAA